MITKVGDIVVFDKVSTLIPANKFYTIIVVDQANIECNYGPNNCTWVKTKIYNYLDFKRIYETRIQHGYEVIRGENIPNIAEVYSIAKTKLEKLAKLDPMAYSKSSIINTLYFTLLKYGKLSSADMEQANKRWSEIMLTKKENE